MNDLIRKINDLATSKNVILSGLAYSFSILLMIIFFLPRLNSYSAPVILDLSFNYNPDYAYKLLKALGSDGRNFYIFSLYLDFIYLIIYTIFLTLSAAYLLKKTDSDNKPIFYTVLIIPAVGLMDFIENICILNIIFSFPAKNDLLVKAANIATMSKWLIFIPVCIYLASLTFYKIFRSLKKR